MEFRNVNELLKEWGMLAEKKDLLNRKEVEGLEVQAHNLYVDILHYEDKLNHIEIGSELKEVMQAVVDTAANLKNDLDKLKKELYRFGLIN